MKSVIHLGVARSLESLASQFLREHPLIISVRSARSAAVVFGPGARKDFRQCILDLLDSGQPIHAFDSTPGFTPALLLQGIRRTTWTDVDVDARAPRLRTVRLPKLLMDSHAIAGATDLRIMGTDRPLVALGLWAPLTAPVQRLGSLITGAREGLTAEIGLAIDPSALVAIANLSASGPLVGIVSDDPIAVELMALAIWQSRRPSTIDLPGPWEDPLVQRATELGLGVTQPSRLSVELVRCGDLAPEELDAAHAMLASALSLIGIADGPGAQE